MRRLALVDYFDLLAVLDYAQPDEEKDVYQEPENDGPGHVVHVMRRLRQQANTALWEIDSLQFARLLSEIMANVDLNDDMLMPVADSMDLDLQELLELFNRADDAWEATKAAIPILGNPRKEES